MITNLFKRLSVEIIVGGCEVWTKSDSVRVGRIIYVKTVLNSKYIPLH